MTVEGRLKSYFESIQSKLNKAYSKDTVYGDFSNEIPSQGQCAVTALYVNQLLGGDFISIKLKNTNHWFNRVYWEGECFDVDLTAIQTGQPEDFIFAKAGKLYKHTQERNKNEISRETYKRYVILTQNLNSI